jgi:hypothetical protein
MNEEEFYVDKSKVENIQTTILYDKDGNVVTEDNKFFFLKQVQTDKETKYFLLFDQSSLVDPLGDNTFFRNYQNLTLKKVNEKIGKLYLRYLKEKNSRFFTLCRRDLNG